MSARLFRPLLATCVIVLWCAPTAFAVPNVAVNEVVPVTNPGAVAPVGGTVWFNPTLGGSFTVRVAATDPSGINRVEFPPAGLGWGAGGADSSAPHEWLYTWAPMARQPGPLPVVAIANDQSTRATGLAIMADPELPTGGSITYPNGATTAPIVVGFTVGQDARSGVKDWSMARRQAVRAANGTCGAMGEWSPIGPPKPAAPFTDWTSGPNSCYQYQLRVTDRVGNQQLYESSAVAVVAPPPPPPPAAETSIEFIGFIPISNPQWMRPDGTRLWFNPNHAGSVEARVQATSAAGVANVAFDAPGAGWSPGTSTNDAAAPFQLQYAFVAGAVGNEAVRIRATATDTSTDDLLLQVTSDGVGPVGGSISYPNGIPAVGFNISFSPGTDAGSGMQGWKLQRREAPQTAAGCDLFGPWMDLPSMSPTSPQEDKTPMLGRCYQYRVLAMDRVGNETTFASDAVLRTPMPQLPPPAPVRGSGGADQMGGSTGSDRMDGGSGNDKLSPGRGNDVVAGGVGDDVGSGGDGNDDMDGGSGNDSLDGGTGDDMVNGSAGNDRTAGGSGGDQVRGGAGNDRVSGDDGNDHLSGGPGADALQGGAGNDVVDAIDGQRGDSVSCGPGIDFVSADRGDKVARDCERTTSESRQGAGGAEDGVDASTRVTICHATGSATNPFVQASVSARGLGGHAGHAEDLIPAPPTGCARQQEVDDTISVAMCPSDTPVDMLTAGPGAIALQSCVRTGVMLTGDPWVMLRLAEVTGSKRFGVGYGTYAITLASGASVAWTTNAVHSMESMTITKGDRSTTVLAVGPPMWGLSTTMRTARTDLTHGDLVDLAGKLRACTGPVLAPISCS